MIIKATARVEAMCAVSGADAGNVILLVSVPKEFVDDAPVSIGTTFEFELEHVTPKIRADRRRAAKRKKGRA